MTFSGLKASFRGPRARAWFRRGLVVAFVLLVVLVEFHTSWFQSWIFSRTNARLSYKLAAGPSSSIAFPQGGPFDDRRGYSKIPALQKRLENHGFRVVEQARQSATMAWIIDQGISPPDRYPVVAGLEIRGAGEVPLYQYAPSEYLFQDIDAIPPMLVKTLLFLENRELGGNSPARRNPAIEWDRLFKAVLLYAGSKLGLPVSVQGGSTLAVQLEKYRHSPRGRTESGLEKLRQLFSASLKAYRDGPETRSWRNRIIVDYLNTVPLAAAPGYGEIHGLGEGLKAWFGLKLNEVVDTLNSDGVTEAKARAFKHVLALLVAVRGPSVYLIEERESLEERVARQARLLTNAGIIDRALAEALTTVPVEFSPSAPEPPQPSAVLNKAANAQRTTLTELLATPNFYDLDRLHLQVDSTIDVSLQEKVTALLRTLMDPTVVKSHNLDGEKLLEGADPKPVVYSFLLVERTEEGNVVRVHADNLPKPFDFNKSVKLELGSTAKLRALSHYLEVVAGLWQEFTTLDKQALRKTQAGAHDPITRWAGEMLNQDPKMKLESFLDRALERRYSASPYEPFFTGGGLHHFENFDPLDNGRVLSVREAFRHSTNLVFIRLMRDLVAYHRARLPYDADALMADPNHPARAPLLKQIAGEESRAALQRAYQKFGRLSRDEIVARLLGKRAESPRHLAILFFAWQLEDGEAALADWLAERKQNVPAAELARFHRLYASERFNLADYAFLLSLHPLELWCAGELIRKPGLPWQELLARSESARDTASTWLFKTKNQRAQDLRLRIRIEKDAFARLAPYWRRLGFPFATLVPSYATAIGSSSDRPLALAELMGIIANDGTRRTITSLKRIRFARGTPYETLFEPAAKPGEQLLLPEVARALKKLLADVVEEGTARRLKGAFRSADGTTEIVGGKTGSGDNRFQTFGRGGQLISSRATNRTAAFVFYIGDRYFGVITSYVQGEESGRYRFTSALPVAVLKLLAPTLMARLEESDDRKFIDASRDTARAWPAVIAGS